MQDRSASVLSPGVFGFFLAVGQPGQPSVVTKVGLTYSLLQAQMILHKRKQVNRKAEAVAALKALLAKQDLELAVLAKVWMHNMSANQLPRTV